MQGALMGKDTSDRGMIASSLSPFLRQVLFTPQAMHAHQQH